MAQIPISLDIVGCLKLFEEEIRFSTCPKKNKKKLENVMDELKRIQRDVTTIFQEQERTRPRTECQVVVKGWLGAVNGIETEVNTLLDDLKKTSSCTCCCFPRHNYRLGKEVVDLIERVHKLVEERRSFDDKNLVRPIPPDPIDNVPDLPTTMIGRDGKLLEIQDYLRDSEVTTIGILGIGGIGKTTMLKSMKYWLSKKDHDFHYIIWIEMSQNDDDVLKIQQEIASCISLEPEHEERKNARMLANALRSRKSLVLIDNVWKKPAFEKIGIPLAVEKPVVKILFTTRSEGVCNDMRAHKIVSLNSLDEKESLQLFKTNISNSSKQNLTQKIVRQRVDEILKRCGGLPLVIVTVARTVANYTRPEEWNDAVECLRSSREEIEGMDEVIKCLKFSYDKLEDDKIKSCLLYLSLYPEGYQVTIDELIKEWVAEGFLDTPNDNSFRRSYQRGVVIISKLKSNCLVEKSVYSDDRVKLHDEIRHMLCWIREQENKGVFIVSNADYKSNKGEIIDCNYDRWDLAKSIFLFEGQKLDNVEENKGEIIDCNYDRWDLAKRIFLFEGLVKRLPETGMPECPNLTTLLVEDEYYAGIRIDKLPTEDFFLFTPSLRVLDLSFTGLVHIPKSIGELVELRYLNLRRTRIHTLPMELANLKKLKFLDLGNTLKLVTIVGSAISQLSALQSLNLCNTSYQWKSDDVNMTTQPPPLKLEDLRALKNLEDLGVDVRSNSHLDTILCYKMLLKSIARISFIRIDFTNIGNQRLIEWISQILPELMNLIVDGCALATDILEIKDDQLPLVTQLNLRRLEISSVTFNDASRPFSGLKILQIFGCQQLKEVSWTAHIPSLEELQVKNCNSVKELVEEDEEEIKEERHYFPKLHTLQIKDLENLESIHGRSSLLFPALRRLFIENCPELKQLSFSDDSAKNMEYIKCEKIQWDLLKWGNDQVQAKFSPYVHWISPIPSDPIDNIPDLRRTMVGRDGKLLEIQDYLRDSEVTTIGILGIGGIGKTTMLKSIKEWLLGNYHDFHYIIWIEMSQHDDSILKIQRQIASCIFLSLPSEHEEWENAKMLASALRSRKSLVLIDNVWKKLAFEKIGIPLAVEKPVVKILFTTRSEGVCNDMRAQKIVSLNSLDEKESLQLFKTNISNSSKQNLTQKIVRQRVDEILKTCGGLPLAIVTVARTVANYTQVEEWDHAVECLRSSREIGGMDDLRKRLKFIYDKLEDDKIKSCLLYLSLYPEDVQITTDFLIKEWVAEGFLDTSNDNSFKRSYKRGVVNINKLKSICLVEKSVYSNEVKLHDLIRHMLCWIREHENKQVFIVSNEISDCNYDRWDLAKRIFLLEGQLKGLPETGMPSCPNLTSLLVQAEDYAGNQIDKLPSEEFFHFTPSLRVLDLSNTGLVDIPKSIGELVELRYLNLHHTRIRTLPMELANLKKLKCLDLGDTSELVTIIASAISQLSALQSLNLCNTSYQWKSDYVNMTTQHQYQLIKKVWVWMLKNMTTQYRLLKLEDLRELKNLEDLGVDVRSKPHLDTILCDEMLLKSIAKIRFVGINFITIDLGGLQPIEWISQRLPELGNLIVDGCALATDILEIKDDQLPLVTQLNFRRLEMSSVTLNDTSCPFSRLKILQIFGCQRLKEVSWTARIPSLEELQVENCNSVKELVEEITKERRYFPKLYTLQIKDLENLESIHGRSPLLFPALRRLFIENCPKLKQLSFCDDSAKNMEFILCKETQWDSLEWENDEVQAKFSPYVRASLQYPTVIS